VTLPAGFGYVFNEFQMSIQNGATASDYGSVGHWRLSQSSKANTNFDYRQPFDFLNFSQDGVLDGVVGSRVPEGTFTRTPIVPPTGGATQSFSVVNLAATVAATGTIDFVASFWEYDLEQIAYFPVHSPVGVYSR